MTVTGIKQINKIKKKKKKKLAELKKTHDHLSLQRLHRITMQEKKRVKVEHIRVVSLKVSIAVPYDLHDYFLYFLLTQHRHDGPWLG